MRDFSKRAYAYVMMTEPAPPPLDVRPATAVLEGVAELAGGAEDAQRLAASQAAQGCR